MKFTKRIIALGILTIVAGIFSICHSTPSLATRTHIFMKGYPMEAIGKTIPDYVVTKKGFLYFAQDYDSTNTP